MNRMCLWLVAMTGALGIGGTVLASPPGPSGASADPVAASFERDLGRPATTGRSVVQIARNVDPLHTGINVALWQGAEQARLRAAFERDLGREPTGRGRVDVADRRSDPLQRHVNAVLWREQTGATSLAYRWYRRPAPVN